MFVSVGLIVLAVIILIWVICDHVRKCCIELHSHYEENHRVQMEEMRKIREQVSELAEVVEALKR